MTGIVTGCVAAVLMSVLPGVAQQPAATAKPQAGMHAGMQGDMAARCKAMMADREKLMAEMKSADQRIDGLVVKMNAASGADKANATAAVVNEMIAQRRAMQDGMMKMQSGMMTHMGGHMQDGKNTMAMCPMMKQMDMKH